MFNNNNDNNSNNNKYNNNNSAHKKYTFALCGAAGWQLLPLPRRRCRLRNGVRNAWSRARPYCGTRVVRVWLPGRFKSIVIVACLRNACSPIESGVYSQPSLSQKVIRPDENDFFFGSEHLLVRLMRCRFSATCECAHRCTSMCNRLTCRSLHARKTMKNAINCRALCFNSCIIPFRSNEWGNCSEN